MARSHDDCQGYGIRKCHEGDDQGADSPGPPDVAGFITFREEEVEEEGGAEDRGDGDTDEDVVGRNADKVVVVHCRRRMEAFYS